MIANTAGSSYLVPDTVILHPTNWLNTRLLRDGTGGTIGQYFGGGPFSGAYGAGGAPGVFGQKHLEHQGGAQHLRRGRDGAGRELLPGGPYLAAGRRVRRGDQLAQRLLR